MPGLAVRHRGVGRADQQVAGPLDLREELVVAGRARPHRVADQQVEPVELLPHVGRDDLAGRAGVFAGARQAGEDRVGVLLVERQKLQDVLARGLAVAREKRLVVARGIDQRRPLVGQLLAQVEREIVIDVDEPGHVLGPLDVSRHPEDRVRHSAQHRQRSLHAVPAGVRSRRAALRLPWLTSTQVSLLPPPCELLTIIEPWRNATRVSPPGNT